MGSGEGSEGAVGVLAAAAGMENDRSFGLPLVACGFEGVRGHRGAEKAGGVPADDAAGGDGDDSGEVEPAPTGRDAD
ncbi:hypothetical protein NRK68_36365 (plasmid) [Streptomyces yangpuensis]|uniref:Uncharacterized protein n=1 Tax=Streptomyces yangpuensis TaxID=1648182 RepID=A0ABY5QAQ4_9ACTN|nr:hypothetical protein [Streptomyces yangpuensis]UUY52715.1 hypothetical protein NRK68_36365 [Streptomyces yangpuensis]